MPTNRTFISEVKDLFFRADINGSYETNLKYYRALDFLKETKPEGFTIYPPLSELGTDGRDSSFQSFEFDHHPYANELGRGKLNIDKRGYDKEALSNLMIYYLFKSRQNAEKAYLTLTNRFSGLATIEKSSKLKGDMYTKYVDSVSNFPGLLISLDNGDNFNDGFILTLSIVR